eukprot:gnl/MRDRNA2_/MRDRNA2_178695_c0_seq1.p1 gnl/MRDRNA2_/MRDRNA2_178695_c0~~gnl/MRDRNA2_/MRDRNA2_178695_c0_seq1.p1  ORF type:complete len:297 (+),score=79.90 gnl/MRDRNA2_/MRDRNA2_178695_c0_seq1:35-892(+)
MADDSPTAPKVLLPVTEEISDERLEVASTEERSSTPEKRLLPLTEEMTPVSFKVPLLVTEEISPVPLAEDTSTVAVSPKWPQPSMENKTAVERAETAAEVAEEAAARAETVWMTAEQWPETAAARAEAAAGVAVSAASWAAAAAQTQEASGEDPVAAERAKAAAERAQEAAIKATRAAEDVVKESANVTTLPPELTTIPLEQQAKLPSEPSGLTQPDSLPEANASPSLVSLTSPHVISIPVAVLVGVVAGSGATFVVLYFCSEQSTAAVTFQVKHWKKAAQLLFC